MKLKLWRSLLLGLCLSNAIAPQVQAQIIPDGTTNTNVDTTDSVINIERGDRAGANLFHSFEEFSVPNGSEAFYNNANDIVNIFSRVTGGDISNIDGLIRANGDANLFLINPAGIVFGEGASLDIGGSLFASTAESIVFTDDMEFSATNIQGDNAPLLTVNMPIGLNYGNNPGSIAVNDSNLEVDNGEALSLLGGDVTITGGQITAPGGNINIAGVSPAGRVSFEVVENGIDFNFIRFPEAIARKDVTLSNGASVNVQATGGGDIAIIARNLELSGGESGASNLRAGIEAGTDSTEAQAGNIVVDVTDNITADGGSSIINSVEESAVGDAGAIDITTMNLSLTQGGVVDSSTAGQGNTGEITLNANGTIEVDGEDSEGFASGIFSIVEETGQRDAGRINLTTTNLSLTNGGQVSASTFGQGDAGNITINANSTIEVDGESLQRFPSGIFSRVESTGQGDAADLDINTASLFVADGAVISVETQGQGNAGNLSIQANSLSLSNGASLFASTPVGTGGNIDLQIAENLILQDNSTISAQALENADGGTIAIDADLVIAVVNQNNDIIASANEGTGGNIVITTNAIFGRLEKRSSIPVNNTNDLDASSEFSLEGTGSFNEFYVDTQELPIEVIDVAGLVEQSLCRQGQGSEFVVTGRGGTAPNPTQARDRSVSGVDLVKPVPFSTAEEAQGAGSAKKAESAKEIVEAQGWVINERGMVELVASKAHVDGSAPYPTAQCHKQ